MGLAFLAALTVFGLRERRRKNEEGRGEGSGVGDVPGEGGGGAGGGGKKSNYLRAVGKAAAVATGIAGLLWVAKKLRGKREEENTEGERAYLEEVAAYAKIWEGHDLGNEKELEVEVAGGQVHEREQESESQLSDNAVVMSAALGYTPAPAPELVTVTSPVRRSPSMVSSLSSSTRSQGQYERLVPSPVTDEMPYVWKPPVPSNTQAGGLENRGSEIGARQSDIPAVLRPGGS
ncbi:hypothetical protein F4781DRAFT_388719 [Annulohypoxylon bovei var. microspora]|nr:hypothetical protein F4781DRAFT_388719 [Annulohypoxylon bovei var. microspora]